MKRKIKATRYELRRLKQKGKLSSLLIPPFDAIKLKDAYDKSCLPEIEKEESTDEL